MPRFMIAAAVAVLAGIGLSHTMRSLMPAAPDDVRGVICGLVVACIGAWMWLSDLSKVDR